MSNHIIDLEEKVTDKKLDTALVISSLVYQPTTKKFAVGMSKAMKTSEGLLYGTAYAGQVNIAIEDLSPDDKALKPLFDLIKKAEIKLRNSTDPSKPLIVKASEI